jgi:hypothetical protein
MKNTDAYSDAASKNAAAAPTEKERESNNRIGSIGAAVRRSQPTNATPRATPPPRAATISLPVQPTSLPRTRPHTSPNAAAETSSSPTMSRVRSSP